MTLRREPDYGRKSQLELSIRQTAAQLALSLIQSGQFQVTDLAELTDSIADVIKGKRRRIRTLVKRPEWDFGLL